MSGVGLSTGRSSLGLWKEYIVNAFKDILIKISVPVGERCVSLDLLLHLSNSLGLGIEDLGSGGTKVAQDVLSLLRSGNIDQLGSHINNCERKPKSADRPTYTQSTKHQIISRQCQLFLDIHLITLACEKRIVLLPEYVFHLEIPVNDGCLTVMEAGDAAANVAENVQRLLLAEAARQPGTKDSPLTHAC